MTRALLLLLLAACTSGTALPPVRFANAAPVVAVNDRRDVPRPPAAIPFMRYLYNFDYQFFRHVTRTLELHRDQRALAVNALDEVPSSTWFTNRIGARALTPEEVARGPAIVGSPELHRPWTVVSSKVGGATLGYIIEDARGEKFLLKFDRRGLPEAETGAHVIMAHLLWAFGFNVSDDYVVYLRESDLVVAPDAMVKDAFGGKRKLDRTELHRQLAQAELEPDGSIRALASHWLAGTPLGGHPFEGTRADDPNDRIPHELRRDLRGAYALFSWLDHNDIHPGNMLDVWITDPVDPRLHYVKHYWLDFGSGLGVAAAKGLEPRTGYEFYVDFTSIAVSLASFGVVDREWEHRARPQLRGIGYYETERYDPGSWVSSTPAYMPIYLADRFDKFWGAKIIMRFTREHLRAVVAKARFSDPRAAEWLTDALVVRQRKTAQYWFERVNPIDEVTVDAKQLCWKDLSVVYAFVPARGTSYRVAAFSSAGDAISTVERAAGDSGVTCVPFALSRAGDGYTIVRVETSRAPYRGVTYVHLARDPALQQPRVVGIWRP